MVIAVFFKLLMIVICCFYLNMYFVIFV